MIAPITTIPAEAATAGIAHPQRRGARVFVFREAAVVVDVVVAAADSEDAFFDEGGCEAGVEAGGGGRFGVGTCAVGDEVEGAVFGEGDMDEGHVHVGVRVARVRWAVFELLGDGVEPVDLGLFEPVVAAELALVGAVAVRVEQVERHGGMGGSAAGEDFEVVVADAVDVRGAGGGKGEREGLDKLHEGRAGERTLVVVVAEDEGIGDGAADEEFGEFEEGRLRIGGCFAVDLVTREDY